MEPRCRSHYNNGPNRLLLSELRVSRHFSRFSGKILTETTKTDRRKSRDWILRPDFSLQLRGNHPRRPAVAAKTLFDLFLLLLLCRMWLKSARSRNPAVPKPQTDVLVIECMSGIVSSGWFGATVL